jgi:hypothetical protein
MKSAFRSPVLRFLLLFTALLAVALGLAAMSPAPELADPHPDLPAALAAPTAAR